MLEGIERLVDLTGPAVTRDAGIGRALAESDVQALAAVPGHFAAVARRGRTVCLARTIGVPLRYFVAKLYHGPMLVVAERIDRIFEWCCEQRIAWQFEPAYTRMVPAHYIVELDQVGCPDPAPRYRRFFEPSIATGSSDPREAGTAYIRAASEALRDWLRQVPPAARIAVAYSGGIDSTAVLLLARQAMAGLGRDPDAIRPCSLDMGDGSDARQAEAAVRQLGIAHTWHRLRVAPDTFNLSRAIHAIEDYHPLDVECAAAGLCLAGAIREQLPGVRHLLDGDGGDENLKSYPLADSDLTLSSVLGNPLLYHEGWGVDALKHSLAYSGGLSRGYVRTWAPATEYGFDAFSPFTARPVIAQALAIPFETLAAGSEARLATLKADIVSRGIEAVTGVVMPVNPKRRFQDGVRGAARERATKALCRRIFERAWAERLRAAEDAESRRSGNEITV